MRLAPALWILCLACLGSPRGASGQRLLRAATPALGKACDDLDLRGLALGLEREIGALQQHRDLRPFRFGARPVSSAAYAQGTLQPLLRLARAGAAVLCRELPRRFQFFRTAARPAGRFTAYHHPVFRGSRTQEGPYQHPLYRRPPAPLAELTTADILAGRLRGQGLELVYLDDPTAAWTAHVEGSARVLLPDGSACNLTTDGSNGAPYQNVTRLVLQDGALPKDMKAPPGMTRVRQFFREHPEALQRYWARNPHFVFFRETPLSGTGKFGELVPGRSVAVDLSHVPLGAALWLRSERPDPRDPAQRVPLRRLVLAQDTGAAIRGPDRVDIFFGADDYAQVAATRMNHPGELYVLLGRARLR